MAVSNRRFVRVWQQSRCLDDVAQALGLTPKHCMRRARKMRDHGVPLRQHARRRKESEWRSLADLASRHPEDL